MHILNICMCQTNTYYDYETKDVYIYFIDSYKLNNKNNNIH